MLFFLQPQYKSLKVLTLRSSLAMLSKDALPPQKTNEFFYSSISHLTSKVGNCFIVEQLKR